MQKNKFFVLVTSVLTFMNVQARCDVNEVCNKKWDYIVVGAGTSGCVLAEKLSRCKHKSVLLIDSGVDYQKAWEIQYNDQLNQEVLKALSLSLRMYGAPFPDINNKPQDTSNAIFQGYIYGQSFGGLTAINDQVYERGAQKTWDYIGSQVPGFDWDSVLPFFKEIETAELTEPVGPAGKTRGKCGPMVVKNKPFVGPEDPLDPLKEDIKNAINAKNPGTVKIGKDYNNGKPLGLFEAQYNVTEFSDLTSNGAPELPAHYPQFVYGKRETSFERFIVNTGAIKRSNLTVLDGLAVKNLELEQCHTFYYKASGVVIFAPCGLKTIKGNTTILAAGALNTPLILQRSGIGAKADLETAGIQQIIDLPGVGHNFHDHLWVGTAVFDDSTTYPLNYLPPQLILFGDSGVNNNPPVGTPDLEFIFLPTIVESGKIQWWIDVYVTRHSVRGNLITKKPGLYPGVPKSPNLPYENGVFDPTILPILQAVWQKFLLPLFENSSRLTLNTTAVPGQWRSKIDLKAGMTIDEINGNLRGLSTGTFSGSSENFGLNRWNSYRYGGTCALGNVVNKNFKVQHCANVYVCDASALPVPVQSHMDAPMMMFGKKLGCHLSKNN